MSLLTETANFSYLLLDSFCCNTKLCKTLLLTHVKVRVKKANDIVALVWNCSDSADSLKGSQGTPRIPGQYFRNHCSTECQFDFRAQVMTDPM